MNPLIIKSVGLLAASAALFYSGWTVNQWRHDANELAERTAAEAAFRIALDEVSAISEKLQSTTDDLEKKRMKTTKEIYNETVRVEYRCPLTSDGVRLYNSAASESATSREP